MNIKTICDYFRDKAPTPEIKAKRIKAANAVLDEHHALLSVVRAAKVWNEVVARVLSSGGKISPELWEQLIESQQTGHVTLSELDAIRLKNAGTKQT